MKSELLSNIENSVIGLGDEITPRNFKPNENYFAISDDHEMYYSVFQIDSNVRLELYTVDKKLFAAKVYYLKEQIEKFLFYDEKIMSEYISSRSKYSPEEQQKMWIKRQMEKKRKSKAERK